MSDVREAAERVTRIRGESVARVYNDPSEYEADLLALAEAYLAEHPADDDEPVTAEWLESVGDGRVTSHGFVHWKVGWLRVRMASDVNQWSVVLAGTIAVTAQTRGDVRRLCAALGIEMKENP